MARYAEGTTVVVGRSQDEIQRILRRYGADAFGFGEEDGRAVIMFRAHDRRVRFLIPLPDKADREFRLTPTGRRRTDRQAAEAYDAEHRRRWRALTLAVKALLEVVESGIASFEDVMLPFTVLPDNATVAERLGPQIETAIASGQLPSALLALPPGDDR